MNNPKVSNEILDNSEIPTLCQFVFVRFLFHHKASSWSQFGVEELDLSVNNSDLNSIHQLWDELEHCTVSISVDPH